MSTVATLMPTFILIRVASERSGVNSEWRAQGHAWARLCTSDDGGRTWIIRATPNITQARLFRAGRSLYYLGHDGDLKIMRSDDRGEHWTAPANLGTKKPNWYATACNVWHAKGNVYLVMERRLYEDNKSGWTISNLAPVLLRAREQDDLTVPANWAYASELAFADLMPGYRQNDLALDYFGVPFFAQKFPQANQVSPGHPMHPMGWLETNVVQITDPHHQWFDPQQRTFHLFLRAHTGGTGFAAIAQVVENDDGTMTTGLVRAPSGKTQLFLPFPGGQMRFHVLYDEPTKLYWLLGTQATDSMTRPDALPQDRYQLPNNERTRLVLHFSKNMVDWCFAGLVAVERDEHALHFRGEERGEQFVRLDAECFGDARERARGRTGDLPLVVGHGFDTDAQLLGELRLSPFALLSERREASAESGCGFGGGTTRHHVPSVA